VKSWHVHSLDLKPLLPEILSSSPDARAIALDLRAGEGLPDHQVHERAWIVVVEGEVEIASARGEGVSGGAGLLVEIPAAERHEVVARTDARLLLILTPWPGVGHPGAMTLRSKLYARRHAAKQRVQQHLRDPQQQPSEMGDRNLVGTGRGHAADGSAGGER
jgi:quercetin dioxygenase-like cupin family protein